MLSRGGICRTAFSASILMPVIKQTTRRVRNVVLTYEVSGRLSKHSYHLMRAIDASLGGFVVACAWHAVLAYHVHHLEVTGQVGLMVFK